MRVLLVGDESMDAVAGQLRTSPGSFQLRRLALPLPEHRLSSEAWADVVLIPLGPTSARGLELLSRFREALPNLPVVGVTEHNEDKLGTEAVQHGAQDYLVKGRLDGTSVERSLRHAIERHKAQTQIRQLFMSNPDGIVVLDLEGTILFANPSAAKLFGTAAEALTGVPLGCSIVAGEKTELNIGASGVAEMRVTDIHWDGRAAYLASLRDVTEREQVRKTLAKTAAELESLNARLEALATTDPLTGVLNRRGLVQALSSELKRMRREQFTLVACLVDCDDFKRVNDTLGYAVGDEVLKTLARTLLGVIRETDYVGRIGGDEFILLLPDTPMPQGLVVAERLRLAIFSSPLPVIGKVGRVTASLGVAEVDSSATTVDEVLALTELALKASKAAGKNRVSARASPTSKNPSEKQIRTLLSGLIKGAEVPIRTVAQEIVRIPEEDVVGYELLARGPKGPLEMPSHLFGAATEQNLLTSIDIQCLRASLQTIARFSRPSRWHVNLFPSTVVSMPPQELVDMIDEAHAAGQVCVEFSEQQFIGDPGCLLAHRNALRENGILLALDDVGFGRSSLEALIVLEPEVVKIDRRCVVDVSRNVAKLRRLRRLMRVVRSLDAKAIVEGIESRQDLAVLRDIGVGLGQGFLWGRPRHLSSDPQPLSTILTSVNPRAERMSRTVSV